ncbi:MAG: hypothetical protein AABW88_04395 [Nanoarchaeota archaeon]
MLLVMLLPAVNAADTIVTVTVSNIVIGATPYNCFQYGQMATGVFTPVRATWSVNPGSISKTALTIAVGDTVTFVTPSTGPHTLSLAFEILADIKTGITYGYQDAGCKIGGKVDGGKVLNFQWDVIV